MRVMGRARVQLWLVGSGKKQKTRLGLESGSAEGFQAALGRSLRSALITIVAGPTRATRRV